MFTKVNIHKYSAQCKLSRSGHICVTKEIKKNYQYFRSLLRYQPITTSSFNAIVKLILTFLMCYCPIFNFIGIIILYLIFEKIIHAIRTSNNFSLLYSIFVQYYICNIQLLAVINSGMNILIDVFSYTFAYIISI